MRSVGETRYWFGFVGGRRVQTNPENIYQTEDAKPNWFVICDHCFAGSAGGVAPAARASRRRRLAS